MRTYRVSVLDLDRALDEIPWPRIVLMTEALRRENDAVKKPKKEVLSDAALEALSRGV